MAKDDFWDRLGKSIDPLGSYDYNGDGIHDWWETTDAEIDEDLFLQEQERKRRSRGTLSFDDDDFDEDYDEDYDDGFDDSDDVEALIDEVDEFLHPKKKRTKTVTEQTITISFHIADDDEGLTEEEKRKSDAARCIENFSKKTKLDEYDTIQKKRCELILKDDCIAARYLSRFGFEIMDAILKEFKLPSEYTDNYDIDDNLYVNLSRIKKYSIELIFKILRWIYAEFYPYKELEPDIFDNITNSVISFDNMDEEQEEEIYDYICKNHTFFAGIISETKKGLGYHLSDILFKALHRGQKEIVLEFSIAFLKNENMKLMSKVREFESLLNSYCIYELDYKAVKNFSLLVYPLLEKVVNDVSNRTITCMKRKIDEYLREHDDEDDEQEHVREEIDWRKCCTYPNPYNLNPADFSSHTEFTVAYNNAVREEREQKIKAAREAEQQEMMSDNNVYELYGVYIDSVGKYYYYFANGKRIKIGDTVIVPFGAYNKETFGTVICIKKTKRMGISYPVDKIKAIIKKVADDID